MGRIPDEYLPPEDLRPTRIRTIPEVQAYPNRMNPTSELLDRQVEQGRGGRPAIRFQDRVITYAGLQEQANRLGNVLAARGVEEEDRVVILSPNQPLSVAANFAVMKLGAIPVPASPLRSPPGMGRWRSSRSASGPPSPSCPGSSQRRRSKRWSSTTPPSSPSCPPPTGRCSRCRTPPSASTCRPCGCARAAARR